MNKITIISGTNRQNSYTEIVSQFYLEKLKELGKEANLFSLQEIESILSISNYFDRENEALAALSTKYIKNVDVLIFIVPEYNGSYPGILKLFLDTVSPSIWENKKVCLTGVSTGRAGNLRGIEHLTSVLSYLKTHVYYNKLPISQVDKIFLNETCNNEETVREITKQLNGFLSWN